MSPRKTTSSDLVPVFSFTEPLSKECLYPSLIGQILLNWKINCPQLNCTTKILLLENLMRPPVVQKFNLSGVCIFEWTNYTFTSRSNYRYIFKIDQVPLTTSNLLHKARHPRNGVQDAFAVAYLMSSQVIKSTFSIRIFWGGIGIWTQI